MSNRLSSETDFSGQRILRDSAVLSSLFAAFVYGTLAYNAEIWVHDYPADIQAKWGEKSDQAKRQTKLVGPIFILLFLGGIVISNLQLRRRNGGKLTRRAGFCNAYAVYTLINLFDLVILDWLIFTWYQPDFVVLPGTEGMDSYKDYAFHAKASAKGSLLGLLIAAIIATVTAKGEE